MQKKPIMLVEDSDAQRQWMVRHLAVCDHPIVLASNGLEALKLVRRIELSVILMDIDMPVMDGLQACRALTRDPGTRDIPVVMLSSCDRDASRLRATMRGALDYLTKPVTRQQLCHTLGPVFARNS